MVQLQLTDDVSQRSSCQIFNRGNRTLHAVGKQLGIGNLIKDNAVNLHGNVIAGDDRLLKIDHLLFQGDPFCDMVDKRNLKVYAVVPGLIIRTQALHNKYHRLRNDFNVGNQ